MGGTGTSGSRHPGRESVQWNSPTQPGLRLQPPGAGAGRAGSWSPGAAWARLVDWSAPWVWQASSHSAPVWPPEALQEAAPQGRGCLGGGWGCRGGERGSTPPTAPVRRGRAVSTEDSLADICTPTISCPERPASRLHFRRKLGAHSRPSTLRGPARGSRHLPNPRSAPTAPHRALPRASPHPSVAGAGPRQERARPEEHV